MPRGSSGRRERIDTSEDGSEGADCSVLRLMVTGVNVRMGFRMEKGFVMEASVNAVAASGAGGVEFLSINPAALWGQGLARHRAGDGLLMARSAGDG